jgi:hypothetical protein
MTIRVLRWIVLFNLEPPTKHVHVQAYYFHLQPGAMAYCYL